MASWNDILLELGTVPGQLDFLRTKYLNELSTYTGRNTIAYYSAFLNKQAVGMDVNDSDMNGFMNAVRGMDCSCGLDIILHTPGGSPVAAEAIVKYLRKKFGTNIRAIVPQLSMSAGTMMACAAKEIVMGAHSSLGPIDPQFNGIPAYSILKEFNDAKEDLSKNPNNLGYWSIVLQKYPAAFVYRAQEAIDLSGELVKSWLKTGMFKDDPGRAEEVTQNLNEHEQSKEHGRHFDAEYCKNIGLKITDLEQDQQLQDKVLSVHHAFMITFGSSKSAVKIIQNASHSWVINAN